MCTIGAIFRHDGDTLFFKNLDQVGSAPFPEPEVRQGKTYAYLHLGTSIQPDATGVWAGVNEAGLVVLGADGNCLLNHVGDQYTSLNASLEAYQKVLETQDSLLGAVKYLMDFYEGRKIGGNGDIILVGLRGQAVAMEYTLNRWGIEFSGDRDYMVRTNFFQVMRHIRPAHDENSLHMSSALRHQRVRELLSRRSDESSLADIFALLRDHDHGPSAMSLCRHGGRHEYQTSCSLVVRLGKAQAEIYTLVNSPPCEGQYERRVMHLRQAKRAAVNR